MATSDPRFSTNPTNSVEGGSFQRPSEGEGIVASENTGPLSQPVNPNASVPSDPKGGQFERLRQRGEYLESGGHFETPILPDPVFYYLESVIFPLLEEEDAVSTSILVGGLLIGEPYPSESLLPGGTIVSGELKNIVQNQNYDPTLEGIIPGGIVVSGTLITVVVNTSYDPTLEGIIPGGTVVSGTLITVVVNTSYDPTLEGIIPGGTVVSGVLT
jgi:hypothetical protein